MSGATTRMDRATALEIATRFRALLDGTYDRLTIAGSIRRNATAIGDVEIVAVPKVRPVSRTVTDLFGDRTETSDVDLLDDGLGALAAAGGVQKRLRADGKTVWGPTLKFLTYEGVPIDLFSPCAERFGWILLLRTGPAEFSRQLVQPRGMRTKDNRSGLLPDHIKPRDGWLTYRVSGERIPTPTEQSVFELFGLPYREPWERR